MGNPAPVLVPHGVDALLAPGVTTPRLTAWRLDCRAYPHQRDRLRLRPQPTNGVNERLLRYTHSAKVIGRVAVSRPRASLSLRARVQKPTTIAPTPLALSLADSAGAQWRCVQCVVPCQPDTRPRASPTRDVLMARKEGSHHARVQVRLVDDGVQLLLLAWSSTCRVTASGATDWSVCHRRSTSIVFQFSRR